MQVRRFEYFCLTLQLVEAEKCLFAWGGHRGVPRGAVILTAELFAALGQWSNVLAFFRERVVESEWVGSYDRMVEPLTRAARATGVYNASTGKIDWNATPEYGAPPATPAPKKHWYWPF